jgi:phosphatidylglycerophosphatase A
VIRFRDRLALGIASLAGAGYTPIAPGTAGSLVALAALWLIPFSPLSLALTLVVVILVGAWAGSRVERFLRRKDPGQVVIDEVAGMMLSVLALPRTPVVLLAAFVLFRLLDIIKPFPARQSQNFSGGIGVMLDDLVAGAYTLALLSGTRALFGWPR